jgi:hypothetical protein
MTLYSELREKIGTRTTQFYVVWQKLDIGFIGETSYQKRAYLNEIILKVKTKKIGLY